MYMKQDNKAKMLSLSLYEIEVCEKYWQSSNQRWLRSNAYSNIRVWERGQYGKPCTLSTSLCHFCL